jgi:hypothetical protein
LFPLSPFRPYFVPSSEAFEAFQPQTEIKLYIFTYKSTIAAQNLRA